MTSVSAALKLHLPFFPSDRLAGAPAPPGPHHCFRLRRYGRRILRPKKFSVETFFSPKIFQPKNKSAKIFFWPEKFRPKCFWLKVVSTENKFGRTISWRKKMSPSVSPKVEARGGRPGVLRKHKKLLILDWPHLFLWEYPKIFRNFEYFGFAPFISVISEIPSTIPGGEAPPPNVRYYLRNM